MPIIDYQVLDNIRWSDHLPKVVNWSYTNTITKTRKTITIKKRLEPNEERVRQLLSTNNWPTTKLARDENISYERRVIRSTLIKKEQYKIFERNKDLESKELELKTLTSEKLWEYMRRLDLSYEIDIKTFHKILKSLTKYKVKNSSRSYI